MGLLRIHTVERARKMHIGPSGLVEILIGDKYYWTKANYQDRVCSKKRSVIEKWIKDYRNSKRGEFSINLEDWQSRLESLESEEEREELLQEIDEFLDQKNESRDNLPESLQESHVLNEQIEELESFREEVESAELEDED